MNVFHQLVVFKLDGQRFALHLAVVERIEQMVEITPLPSTPENVLGVVNLKGQVIPVFNVRRRFRLAEREVDARDHLIFARTKRRPVALAVDAVGEVVGIGGADLVAAEDILPGLECLEGVVKLEDGLVLIHDLDRFLSVEEDATLAEAMRGHD